MRIATLADAPVFELGALRLRPLAVPSRGSRELAVWRVDLPAGGTSGPHALDHEQVIVIGTGSVTAYIEGRRTTAGPGDALILPINTVLELRNDSGDAASATVISPVGFQATASGHTFAPPWSR